MAVTLTSTSPVRTGILQRFRLSANNDALLLNIGARTEVPDIDHSKLPDEEKVVRVTIARRDNTNANTTIIQTFHPFPNASATGQWEDAPGFGNGQVGSGGGRANIRTAVVEAGVTGMLITTNADVDVLVSSLAGIVSSVDG